MSVLFDEDVVLAKASNVKKCLDTVKDLQADAEELTEWVRLDVTVLNLQRAIQACIDLAHHLIAENGWELPRTAGLAFEILAQKKVIDRENLNALIPMVGFRNVAVHAYTDVDPAVVQGIVRENLGDLDEFCAAVLRATLGAQEPSVRRGE